MTRRKRSKKPLVLTAIIAMTMAVTPTLPAAAASYNVGGSQVDSYYQYGTYRYRPVAVPPKYQLTKWVTNPACEANLRFSLRTTAGNVATNSLQWNRPLTGTKSFTPTNLSAQTSYAMTVSKYTAIACPNGLITWEGVLSL